MCRPSYRIFFRALTLCFVLFTGVCYGDINVVKELKVVPGLPSFIVDAFAQLSGRKSEVESDSSEHFGHILRDEKVERKKKSFNIKYALQLPSLLTGKNVSQHCLNGFLMALPALLDIAYGKIPFWPLHLFDSTGKSAIGSLRGTRRIRGNLHECIGIKAKTPKILESFVDPVNFEGKFCHIIAEHGPENVVYHMENEVIPPTGNRRTLDTEICFPSLCSDHDVVSIVETFSNELLYDEFEITYLKCVVYDKGPLSFVTIAVIVICSLWAMILLVGSGYDLIQEYIHNNKVQNWLDPSKTIAQTVAQPPQHGRMARVLLSFSIPRNFGYLLNNSTEYPEDEVIPVIGGLRFVTFLWVQITTIYLIAIRLPWGNYAGILEDLRTLNFQWILNGSFAAETLFCLSGFLSSYVTLRSIKSNGGHFSFLKYYLRRYLRLAPPYLLVMMLTAAFFWYCFDEGPEWVTKYQYEDACKRHWWKGLLFINNFFKDTETCPPISWFFAVNMQLHLMAPFIIYILYNKPRVAMLMILISITVFSCIPSLFISSQQLPFFIGRLFYFEENHQKYLDLILQMPFTHAGPFLVGMMFGYLRFVSGNTPKINKGVAIFCWSVAAVIVSVIIYGFYPYIDGTRKMPAVLGFFYAALTPSLWALAVGWLIYACSTGYGPVINDILSWNIFSNFNRLSYCCFLGQALAIKHFLLSRPDPLYYEPWMMTLIINGSTLIAIFGGIAVSVAIERPVLEVQEALNYNERKEEKEIGFAEEDEYECNSNGDI